MKGQVWRKKHFFFFRKTDREKKTRCTFLEMDTFGNYPGSILKTLTVEQDALVGGDLTVDGDLTVNGSIIGPAITPDRVYTEDGTESLPAYSFKDEKDTGWYRSGTGEVSLSERGTKRLRLGETSSTSTGTWAATKFYSDDGTATAPAVSFTSDTTSGWYKSNPGETSFASLGTVRFNIGQVASSTPTTFTSLRNYTTDGTVATPSTSYASETNTGWYLSAPGEVSYSGRGTRRLRLGETSADYTGSFSASSLTSSGTVTGTIWLPQGTVAMVTTSAAPAVQLVSNSAALQFNVGSNVTGSFSNSGASFPLGASALVITATSSSLGSATATSLNVQTLTSTTSTLGTASASSLSATTLTATTSTLGTATASSLTASTMTATTSTVTTLTCTTANATTVNAININGTNSSLGFMLGSTLALSSQAYIELENTSSMTITTSTDTLCTFTNIFRQVGTGLTLDGGDSGSVVVASSTNGFYCVTAVCQWSYNASGTRESWLLRNSSYRVGWSALPAPSTTTNLTVTVTATTYMLTTGSTMQFRVWQTSGGDLTLSGIRLYMGRVW